jgi:cytochrome c oxidase assembly protein subunit 15
MDALAARPTTGAGVSAPASRLKGAANAALAANVGIVITGALVRITGSGLGCADWPRCEQGSFVPVAGLADGWHAAIEFGNRLLTFVVLAATLWFLWKVLAARRSSGGALPPLVTRIAWLLPIGVLVQAVIGGITVLTGLNWWTVSVHFLVSMVLISLAVTARHALVADPDDAPAAPGIRHGLTGAVAVGFLVLILGTFVTAAGPHGGDANAPRIGIDIRPLAIAHADGVWLLLGGLVALLLVSRSLASPRLTRALAIALFVALAQGGVGYLQYWLGIPRELVSLHVVGATLVWLTLSQAWNVAHRPGLPSSVARAPEGSST